MSRSHDSGGDDDEDDAQLKSLRAVWLALPDEDPPERGLAELMAAARVKAEQMTKPSVWQRISALLRRPPMLALATVLVLIGGAVFIGQRHSKMEATPPALEQRARDNASPVAAGSAAMAPETVAVPEGAAAGAAPAPADETAKPAEPTAEPAPEPKKDVAQKTEAPPRTTHRSPANTTTTKISPTTTLDLEKSSPKAGFDDKAGKKTETRDEEVTSGLIEGDLDEKQSDRFASPPPPAEAPAVDSRAVGGATKGATTPAPDVKRAQQFIAQAKLEAARGNCAAARTLMKRVASLDAASYRKALANDAALNKCFN